MDKNGRGLYEAENGASGKQQLFYNNSIWVIKDVAELLNVSVGHIYNLTSRREIPFRKKGKRGRLYFIPSEILNWVEEGGV